MTKSTPISWTACCNNIIKNKFGGVKNYSYLCANKTLPTMTTESLQKLIAEEKKLREQLSANIRKQKEINTK